jgi:anti-anti-sigma regulatory factor
VASSSRWAANSTWRTWSRSARRFSVWSSRAGDWLALDLRALTSMDSSSGVRPILHALQNAEQHGAELALIRGPHAVQRVLELVGRAGRLRTVDDLTSLL